HRVTTQSLADHLKVKPASVTGMIKKLADVNLIIYERYKGVQLTESGEKVAIEVLRHHRLIEMYLAEVLGYSWDEIHDEAERLEHHISEKFEQRIAEKLGHPTHDPHGDPIPDVNLKFPEGPCLVVLTELKAGQKGQIKRVRTQDSDALNLLTKLDLVIGNTVETIEKIKDGVRVVLNGERLLVPISLARQIMIEKS
ncbi:MAG TPA: DtxR family transcriptional regulator, partial [Bacteroidetes bacterium]|nr:DtxR family transcriptional regulator [Bacteroidota bacterium]